MLDNIVLRSGIAQGRLVPLPVTLGTEFRDISRKYRRIKISLAHDIMVAMAIGAVVSLTDDELAGFEVLTHKVTTAALTFLELTGN